MGKNITAIRSIFRYDNGELTKEEDQMATEYPLTVMVNGEEFVTLVCSPDHLEELVIGFLASEGVIRFKKEIKRFTIDESLGFAYVDLVSSQKLRLQDYTKRVIGSCCGKGRHFYFQQDVKTAKTALQVVKIKPENCLALMREMQENSRLFQHTGGVHNAALCSDDKVMVTRSDIGRHNALDKLYGYCLLHQIPVHDKLIVFSGRISSEVLLKAAKIGVSAVISKSAPTELAIQMAEDLNIMTIGFARNRSFNVYTHHERLQLS
ncbi:MULTISPECIES: formate dehydrogenase accessory sulfurtransferase FdhD [Bacillus]|uniref:Sulfur carrier protein FdhD n=1 Tax=Bacillus glycinifermentans TaxID=1664069 RepID=A0AAJ4D4B5_9BACI|nr:MULTISPECIES: formate dehydrogenase accessory sulfurtransferase FdhD [Bacillus]KKB74278.1 formate dehydrogenase [Bacillus sp. TH008]MBU8787662.1 formate dehydrogenase accessory sulfurtransferase FdhD [Bacillus glycinifermentans]MDU0071885.1 formate dehydrogenase accessory sulfurtransferase FdhD [Bacillus sp. IG6]MED8019510.1 formate dehydrogenase accessory sulfurtransferase FdhD [Bacillus glycinifermentans]NUJ17904.1 formate dehydrogenase accessory sulfurtransferase FdhD [Bacillus glycinife